MEFQIILSIESRQNEEALTIKFQKFQKFREMDYKWCKSVSFMETITDSLKTNAAAH
jgi:hypothetical protein